MWLVTLRNKRFFLCVLSVSFFLHKNKFERLRLLCPHSECVTVSQHQRVNQDVSGYCLTWH